VRNRFRSGCRPRPAIRTCAVQILSPREKTVEAANESFITFKAGQVKTDLCVLEAEVVLVPVLHSGFHDRRIENDNENEGGDPPHYSGVRGAEHCNTIPYAIKYRSAPILLKKRPRAGRPGLSLLLMGLP